MCRQALIASLVLSNSLYLRHHLGGLPLWWILEPGQGGCCGMQTLLQSKQLHWDFKTWCDFKYDCVSPMTVHPFGFNHKHQCYYQPSQLMWKHGYRQIRAYRHKCVNLKHANAQTHSEDMTKVSHLLTLQSWMLQKQTFNQKQRPLQCSLEACSLQQQDPLTLHWPASERFLFVQIGTTLWGNVQMLFCGTVPELRYLITFILPVCNSIDWWSLSSGKGSLWWPAIQGMAQVEK